MPDNIKFFKTPADFREWLEENHDTVDEMWVKYFKKATGKPGMNWEESVKVALCFGWIDGLRKSIDDESYKNRFTPRRPNSHWSRRNIEWAEQLIEEGRMHRAGMKAYEKKDRSRTARASYDPKVRLKREYQEKIKANPRAWKFFGELAPGYTKRSIHWVMSAKREETRLRRLKILIKSSSEGKKIPPLRRG